ncbi:MAG TPA: LptA/OstA family protein, partial [bacterium]
DRLKSLTLFKGNVKATHGKEVLTSDEIRAVSQNREATAAGHVKVVDSAMSSTLTCGNLEYLDQMNTMTAHDHPLMVSLDQSGRPISIQGRQMELDSQKKTVVINQNVQIIHESGRAEAQKATFLSKENQLILEEDPKVFVNNGQLSGRRIVSDLGGENRVLVEGMAEAYFNLNGPATVANGNKKGTASTTNSPLSPGLPVRGAHSPANPQEPVSLQSPDGSFGGTRNGISDSSTSSGENKK